MAETGLLGLPFPFFAAVDGVAARIITPAGSIIFWSLLCSAAVMFLYRLCSPQAKLKEIKVRMREIQGAMMQDPDDLSAVLKLSGENIRIALQRVAFTCIPTCIAVIPLFSITAWINSVYAYETPRAGAEISCTVYPADAVLTVSAGAGPAAAAPGTVVIPEGCGQLLVSAAGSAGSAALALPPVSNHLAHKNLRHWLLGNPAGYLPAGIAADAVEFGFERRQFLGFGPSWLRGWEALFLIGMSVFSIALKIVMKIE